MRRGFAYSLAALALALAVAQIAILAVSPSGMPPRYDPDLQAVDFAAFSIGQAGLPSALGLSCGLAADAATGYERSSNSTFANKSCALSFLAMYGNVTDADCPGGNFSSVQTANPAYSLLAWQQRVAQETPATVAASARLIRVYAEDNGTHTACSAMAAVSIFTAGNSTSLFRTYSATSIIPNPD
jgi:hypothetical protein